MMKPRFATLSAVVLAAALWRVIPHPWNFTPLSAMALFAGAHFSNKKTAYALPLAAMIVSNILLGTMYATLPFVYASFVLTVFIGTLLRGRRDAASIGMAAVGSSLLFFVVTNLGHWAVVGFYPRTSAGLFACFSAAVPFFRNTLLGDLAFTAALFGGFALLERRFPALQDARLSGSFSLLPR